MNYYKVSPAQVEEILARIKQGETVTSLANEFGITRQTIYTYTKAAGGVKRTENPHAGERANRLINKTIKLRRGGFITVSFNGDIFKLAREDLDFLQVLNEILEHYESQAG